MRMFKLFRLQVQVTQSMDGIAYFHDIGQYIYDIGQFLQTTPLHREQHTPVPVPLYCAFDHAHVSGLQSPCPCPCSFLHLHLSRVDFLSCLAFPPRAPKCMVPRLGTLS